MQQYLSSTFDGSKTFTVYLQLSLGMLFDENAK